jgi:solute carrier family 32 (vesicular inhibitory amino acid transporter)
MGFGLSDATLLMLALAVVLPTTWLPDLAALSYVGAAGIVSAIAITAILGYSFATAPAVMPTDLVHLDTLPLTFGLMAFVFAGHAVFPAIYHSLRLEERSKFPRVIDDSFLIVALVCSVVGFTGYSCYGAGTLEEVTVRCLKSAEACCRLLNL